MNLNCDVCNAIFEVELIDCEKENQFSYSCVFCGNVLLNVKDKKEFVPKNIIHYPIPQIALPGIICSVLKTYMKEYKEWFEEVSIKKGHATSSLDISICDDDDVPQEGWSFIQLEGTIAEKHKTEIESLEDYFKNSDMFLQLYFLHNSNQVQIPNIMIPYVLRHEGIKERIISLIYDSCKAFGYRLFIVQMADSSYNNLLKRGATMIDDDSVEITDSTELG